jgi:hypothetical protein
MRQTRQPPTQQKLPPLPPPSSRVLVVWKGVFPHHAPEIRPLTDIKKRSWFRRRQAED